MHLLGIRGRIRVAQAHHWKPKQNLLMKTKGSDQVWVVVEVQSGVPVLAEVFADRRAAKRCQRKLRTKMRQDYDEVGLFEGTVRR